MEEQLENYRCLSPVVLIVFNRPEKTRTLLDVLRLVKPSDIYVISDGPRTHVPSDHPLVHEVRDLIDKEINWDCDVTKIYASSNLSGPIRVPSGFNQIFDKTDRAIILEDDCIPSISFFRFCDELLEKYKFDEGVGTVCGFNLEFDFLGYPIEGMRSTSYFFSQYPASWGWATWSRVWKKFDHEMKEVPDLIKHDFFSSISRNRYVKRFWMKKFQSFYKKEKNNWDYKLTYALMKNKLLSIIPNVNLVANIGTESGANYQNKDYVSRKVSKEINFPLLHPESQQVDWTYDNRISGHFFSSAYYAKFLRLVRNTILRFF